MFLLGWPVWVIRHRFFFFHDTTFVRLKKKFMVSEEKRAGKRNYERRKCSLRLRIEIPCIQHQHLGIRITRHQLKYISFHFKCFLGGGRVKRTQFHKFLRFVQSALHSNLFPLISISLLWMSVLFHDDCSFPLVSLAGSRMQQFSFSFRIRGSISFYVVYAVSCPNRSLHAIYDCFFFFWICIVEENDCQGRVRNFPAVIKINDK